MFIITDVDSSKSPFGTLVWNEDNLSNNFITLKETQNFRDNLKKLFPTCIYKIYGEVE